MSWLRRIPFWGWFLITLVITYGVWNPLGYSVYHMWIEASDIPFSVKLLVTLLVSAFILLFATETYRTLGKWGLMIYCAIIIVILWVFWDIGILNQDNISSAQYWAQIPIALMMTLGSQGTKIYRSMTGRIGVDDPDTQHPDDAA